MNFRNKLSQFANQHRDLIQLSKKIWVIILVILFGAVAILQVEPGHGNISNFFDAI